MMTLVIPLTNLPHSQIRVLRNPGIDIQPKACEASTRVLANDAGVASNLHLGSSWSDSPMNNHNFLLSTSNCRGKLSKSRDGRGGSASLLSFLRSQKQIQLLTTFMLATSTTSMKRSYIGDTSTLRNLSEVGTLIDSRRRSSSDETSHQAERESRKLHFESAGKEWIGKNIM